MGDKTHHLRALDGHPDSGGSTQPLFPSARALTWLGESSLCRTPGFRALPPTSPPPAPRPRRPMPHSNALALLYPVFHVQPWQSIQGPRGDVHRSAPTAANRQWALGECARPRVRTPGRSRDGGTWREWGWGTHRAGSRAT